MYSVRPDGSDRNVLFSPESTLLRRLLGAPLVVVGAVIENVTLGRVALAVGVAAVVLPVPVPVLAVTGFLARLLLVLNAAVVAVVPVAEAVAVDVVVTVAVTVATAGWGAGVEVGVVTGEEVAVLRLVGEVAALQPENVELADARSAFFSANSDCTASPTLFVRLGIAAMTSSTLADMRWPSGPYLPKNTLRAIDVEGRSVVGEAVVVAWSLLVRASGGKHSVVKAVSTDSGTPRSLLLSLAVVITAAVV